MTKPPICKHWIDLVKIQAITYPSLIRNPIGILQ